MTTNQDLAPCPHCGSAAAFQSVPEDPADSTNPSPMAGGMYIECNNTRCGACTALMRFPKAEDAKNALMARWNARSGPTPPPVERDHAVPPAFPTALRKLWSGDEVQTWINAHWAD
jgi:hypothetical protein